MREIIWRIKRSTCCVLLGCAIFVLMTGPVWAEDTENGNQDAPVVPKIKTTVEADYYEVYYQDVTSTATDKKPAKAILYEVTDYDDDDDESYREYEKLCEKKEVIDRKAGEKAGQEAKALARELLDNGRYSELLGYNNAYVRPDYKNIVTEHVVFEKEDNHKNPKNPHSSGYYSTLKDKYPNIMEFCFRKRTDGKIYYWYSYFSDYSSLDFSKVNTTGEYDWFSIGEHLVITGLDPSRSYRIITRLLKINDDGSTKEIDSTDMYTDLYAEGNNWSQRIDYEIDENGRVRLYTYFEGEYEEGKYVLTTEVRYWTWDDSEGELVAVHDDLNDNRERFDIEREVVDNSLIEDGNILEDTDVLVLDSGSTPTGKSGLPKTGDSFNPRMYMLMMSLSLLYIIIYIMTERSYRQAMGG